MALLLAASVIGTLAASFGMLLVSANNYPGGEALSRLHALPLAPEQTCSVAGGEVVVVHLDVPVCMTGATRFLQDAPLYPATSFPNTTAEREWYDTSARNVDLRFDKTEDQETLLTPQFWEGIDWVLSSEAPAKVAGKWEVVEVVRGLKGIRVYRPGEEAGQASGDGWIGSLGRQWSKLEDIGRTVLRGWWVSVEMEDKVWIMKKIR